VQPVQRLTALEELRARFPSGYTHLSLDVRSIQTPSSLRLSMQQRTAFIINWEVKGIVGSTLVKLSRLLGAIVTKSRGEIGSHFQKDCH
jgi:hypothetical protein